MGEGATPRARMGRPSEMHRTVAVRVVTDPTTETPTQVDVTAYEQLIEQLRLSGVVQHACARAGLATKSFYDWVRTGARARRKQLLGQELDERETECLDFLHATEVAQAEGVLMLLAPAHALARGGQEVVTTSERRWKRADGSEVVETATRTEVARPDGPMLRWLLAKRDPARFGDRLELAPASSPGTIDDLLGTGEQDAAQELMDDLRTYLDAQDAAAADEARRTRARKRAARTTTGREA